jgi:GH25 family lysozyme M1 (1,4-beta-N-acetylmuramidase)
VGDFWSIYARPTSFWSISWNLLHSRSIFSRDIRVDPIVYTGKLFWRDQVGGPTSFAGNPLWIAQYTTLCPDLTSPWDTWATAVTARPAAP